MRIFLAFLLKNYFLFFFLFLEAIAFILLVNHNRHHSSVILNATSELTGAITEQANHVYDYFSLIEKNEKLAMENAQLKGKSRSSFLITDTNFFFVDTNYGYIETEIINNTTSHRNNYMMINKGSKHGLDEDMGIVSEHGVAGVIIGVSENYATIMSTLHKDSKYSALIKKNEQLVNVRWDGIDRHYGILENVPTHIELTKGDTIITSGYSFIFPKGMIIGYVDEYFADSSRNLNSARIRFATDFNSLSWVYVIKNYMKNEIIDLQQESINNA